MRKLSAISPLALSFVVGITTAISSPLAQSATSAPASAVLSPLVQAGLPTSQHNNRLATLAENYYNRSAQFEPMAASMNGDNRFDDQLPKTLNPAVRRSEMVFFKQVANQLKGIPREPLSDVDKTTYDCLDYEVQAALRMFKYDDHLLPINHMDSLPVELATSGSGQGAQALETVSQYGRYLKRIELLPTWIDQAIANMRVGMRREIVLPKALIVAALPQFKELATTPLETHAFYAPVTHFPTTFSDADKTKLSAAYRKVLGQKTLPALNRLYTFLEKDYLPAGRASSGWGALPNGGQWYEEWVQNQTTTDLKPEQIHALGLQEVARIRQEFVVLGPKLGYTGEPNGLPGWSAKQDQYHPFKTEAEILNAYRALDKKIKVQLPALFSLIPKAAFDIRPEPEISRATASDHYSPPAIDGSRPGVFWAVINDPTTYRTTGMTTLFLHEARPGHHFHLSLLQELDIPKFRKFGGNNAYTEGWALYAETLGREMHLYDDSDAYLGHLTDELLRASRLVVDTGLHAKGWSREQAIQYLQDTLGYGEPTARNAIERYMAWPGQALGYKLGSLKIMELRQRAQTALGGKFDLRAFHSAILGEGTLPLPLLESKVNLWIEKQRKLL